MHFILIIIVLLVNIHSAFAEEPKNFRFGVLSFRPKDITTKQWQPFTEALQQALPNHTVELLALNYTELNEAARNEKLDFILTNPENYILLKNKIGMNAIATLIRLENGHPTTKFAGVIFTRSDRHDIRTLSDLNDKNIVAPVEESLGGYLMQRWELEKNNITAKNYMFVGMPHDKTVAAVLAGQADAGFVRSGLLETMAHEGKLSLGSDSPIRVLVGNNEASENNFPVLHSTEFYPEWAFCVSRHISFTTTRKISLFLLNIQANNAIAKAASIAGFNSPEDYTPVEVLMLRLRSHPEELKYFNFSDVAWRYRDFIALGLAIGLLVLTLIIFLIRVNRRFKKVANENQTLLLAVEQSPVSIMTTDLHGNIEYVNRSFLETTGYTLNEVIGQTPRLLKSGKVDVSLYQKMWAALKNGEQWRGEIINRRKDGSEYIASSLITPVRQSDEKITHYLCLKQDITELKKIEEQIKQLAFYDPLTGLANRRKLLDRINDAIAISQHSNLFFAVLLVDLDKFKAVNDALGHASGDELLKQVAERITQQLRESDMVARLGGDEFVLVIESLRQREDAELVALKVIAELTLPFDLSKANDIQIGASIGISFYPEHGDSAETLMDHADAALYQAKDNGRGTFAYYQPQEPQTLNT